jgi:hypothetical protein
LFLHLQNIFSFLFPTPWYSWIHSLFSWLHLLSRNILVAYWQKAWVFRSAEFHLVYWHCLCSTWILENSVQAINHFLISKKAVMVVVRNSADKTLISNLLCSRNAQLFFYSFLHISFYFY